MAFDDSVVLARVVQLLNRATAVCNSDDPAVLAATEREAAVAALLACRLISKHSILDLNHQTSHSKPKPTFKTFFARYSGSCWCGESIIRGETRVYWTPGFKPAILDHARCIDILRKTVPR